MILKRVLAVLAAAAVFAALWFVFKSYTDPILSPRAVARLERWEVNGDRQQVLIRGCDRRDPVLLFLHGGPGMPAMFTAHAFQRPLERDFVVVHWDQRGAGKSRNAALDPATMTVTQMLADAEAVIGRLRREFGVRKVVLVGHSHGTWLGARLAARRPDLVSAYVGVGQVADPAAEPAVIDALIRSRLAHAGRSAPPITPSNREALLFQTRGELARHTSMLPLLATGLTAPEYSLADALGVGQGPKFAQARLRYDLPGGYGPPPAHFQVPVTVVMGVRDAVTPVSLAEAWFQRVEAPSKRWVLTPDAAHFPHLEQPHAFARVMRRVKRELGAPEQSAGPALPVPRFGLHCVGA